MDLAATFHTMPDGRRIAFRRLPGIGPALVFLPGYMSDMAGSKATALYDWARAEGRACLLLDYSGCGESEGAFADGTLTRWREEVIALVEAQAAGPVVLIGSSMGGWLMLLAAEALGERVAGLVGIAAAPDFTRWGYSDEQRAALAAGETVLHDNPYGPDPTPTHPAFFADAEAQCRLDREIAIDCPVRLIHGDSDRDVPLAIAHRLLRALRSADVQLLTIKHGGHRLSEPHELEAIERTIAGLLETN